MAAVRFLVPGRVPGPMGMGVTGMSDVSLGPEWWQASDGRWYPPHLRPGHRGSPDEPTWWQASDGRWYPPHTNPSLRRATPAPATATATPGVAVLTAPRPEGAPTPDAPPSFASFMAARRESPPGPAYPAVGQPPGSAGSAVALSAPGPTVPVTGDPQTPSAAKGPTLPPGGHFVTADPPVSTAARTAMVLAILVWPVGVVAAHLARGRIRRTGEGGYRL
ncbi:MAG TPA: hypothetical protein VMB82_05420, partial [Acidimicrobiales bacterium]|nr:hypothetical protein [Acidimicrobiales bacterium]